MAAARRATKKPRRLTTAQRKAIALVRRGLDMLVRRGGADGIDGVYFEWALVSLLAKDWHGIMMPGVDRATPDILKRAKEVQAADEKRYADWEERRKNPPQPESAEEREARNKYAEACVALFRIKKANPGEAKRLAAVILAAAPAAEAA